MSTSASQRGDVDAPKQQQRSANQSNEVSWKQGGWTGRCDGGGADWRDKSAWGVSWKDENSKDDTASGVDWKDDTAWGANWKDDKRKDDTASGVDWKDDTAWGANWKDDKRKDDTASGVDWKNDTAWGANWKDDKRKDGTASGVDWKDGTAWGANWKDDSWKDDTAWGANWKDDNWKDETAGGVDWKDDAAWSANWKDDKWKDDTASAVDWKDDTASGVDCKRDRARGDKAARPCATPFCKYVATWDTNHCCAQCGYTNGSCHGVWCDGLERADLPRESSWSLDRPAGTEASSKGFKDAHDENKECGNSQWQVITKMPTARESLAVAVTDTAVYCIGGARAGSAFSAVDRYVGAQGWNAACQLPSPRYGLAAIALSGSVFVAGGGDRDGISSKAVWRMDVRRKAWAEMRPMQVPRMHLALVGHGKYVYALGGTDFTLVEYLDGDDIGSPWLPMPGLQAARTGLAAVTLGGVIYALGGMAKGSAISSAESFQIGAAKKWNSVPNMLAPRHSFGAAAVSSNYIIVAGGCGANGGALDSVESFDTRTQTWSSEAFLPAPISHLAIAPLSGKVMVFGGVSRGYAVSVVHGMTFRAEFAEAANTSLAASDSSESVVRRITALSEPKGIADIGVASPDSSSPNSAGSMLRGSQVQSVSPCTEDAEKTDVSSTSKGSRLKQRQREAALQYRDKELLARLTPQFQVPRFHSDACGSAKDWNHGVLPMYWGKHAKQVFGFDGENSRDLDGRKPDVNTMMCFFEVREGSDGRPIRQLIGEPESHPDGWWRCAWKAFPGVQRLPRKSLGEYSVAGQADWQRAWHGCKLEALYSIMYHGRLFSSHSEEFGHRMLTGAPGVYVHNDATGQKVCSYYRFAPLCRDGVFWAAKWELYVDRADRVNKKNTDQWVQQPRSVHLSALWLCGRTAAQMEESDEVARWWDPLVEANPFSRIWDEARNVERDLGLAPDHARKSVFPAALDSRKANPNNATDGPARHKEGATMHSNDFSEAASGTGSTSSTSCDGREGTALVATEAYFRNEAHATQQETLDASQEGDDDEDATASDEEPTSQDPSETIAQEAGLIVEGSTDSETYNSENLRKSDASNNSFEGDSEDGDEESCFKGCWRQLLSALWARRP